MAEDACCKRLPRSGSPDSQADHCIATAGMAELAQHLSRWSPSTSGGGPDAPFTTWGNRIRLLRSPTASSCHEPPVIPARRHPPGHAQASVGCTSAPRCCCRPPRWSPPPPKPAPAPAYTYAAVGDPRLPAAVTAPTTPSFVLMGGGPDVDEAFRWMIGRAGIRPGSGGRFVVIRATGTDAYNPYLYYSDGAGATAAPAAEDWVGGAALGLSSVETLVIPSRAAADDDVRQRGGRQRPRCLHRRWRSGRLHPLLEGLRASTRPCRALIGRQIPLGGTSAGLAVLGQFDYTGAERQRHLGAGARRSVPPVTLTLDPSPAQPDAAASWRLRHSPT